MARNPLQPNDNSLVNPLAPEWWPGQNALTSADAYQHTMATLQDWIQAQRAQSAAMGYWNDQTGLPTQAGLMDAVKQYGGAMVAGTQAPGFRAYHGSPHAFDKFDLSKIGAGEGAQAFGHGLYVADAEGVARNYKKAGPTADAKIADINTQLSELADNMGKYPPEELRERYDDLLQQRSNVGHMYEVQVNADPAHFLDWDTPMARQSDHVVNALKQANGLPPEADLPANIANMTGQQLYGKLADAVGGHDVAAQVLQEKYGIPGIRYLDAGSRGAGEGSRNSVVFNPANMEIIRRYGLAGLMAGGGAAAGLQQDQTPSGGDQP